LIFPELYIDPLFYVETTTFSNFSISTQSYMNNNNTSISNLNNKTNFTNLLVSGASTLLSSFNVSGPTNLNNLSVNGNLNVYGTTTIIDTVINNT